MLEPPNLEPEQITSTLWHRYGIHAVDVLFLPLGVDVNAAVYRATAADGTAYFVKLRQGAFDDTPVALAKWLGDQGIAQIIAPIATNDERLWASLPPFKLVLYPFVEGENGYAVALSARQWHDFGAALKRVHTADVPPALASRISREQFAPHGRQKVLAWMAQVESASFDEPAARELAAFLQSKRRTVLDLIARAERLAQLLQTRTPQLVLCHSDVHAGNILIDAAGHLFIVDWDEPILAPKERDLMFAGGAQGFRGHTLAEEEALFYAGYGQADVDTVALAYYRYERIVQDLAAFCDELFLTTEGGDDRAQAVRYVRSNWLPGGTIEAAYASDVAEHSG